MSICFICNQEFHKLNGRHVYFCAKNKQLKLNKSEIKFKQICFQSKFEFTKHYMIDCYVTKGWSLPDFKKYNNLEYESTLFLLEYFGIAKRNSQEAMNSENRKNKYKKTCNEKYGVENVSQFENIKNKKKETFISHYGVDNIWKSSEYKKWLYSFMVGKYGKGSLANKYGNKNKWWLKFSKEERSKMLEKANKGYLKWYQNLTDDQKIALNQKKANTIVKISESSLEKRIANSLSNLCIDYKHQFWIKQKSFDFKISKTNIVIEVNGDYWHANPKDYKADDLISYPDGYKKASDVWNKDLNKKQIAENYGYKVIYLWEKDIKQMNDFQLEKYIFEMFKIK